MRAFLEKYGEGIFVMVLATILVGTCIPLSMATRAAIENSTADYLEEIEEKDYSKTAPGLYDDNMKLVATWGTLTGSKNLGGYEMDVEYNYTSSNYTSANSPYTVLKNDKLKNGTVLVIDSHIESIGSYALSNCTTLKKVILPTNLHTIKNNAFESSTNLELVKIPENVKTVESKAFNNCTKLELILNTEVRTVSSDAFNNIQTLCYRGALDGYPWGAKNRHTNSGSESKCKLCGYNANMAVAELKYYGGIGSEIQTVEIEYGNKYGQNTSLPTPIKDGFDFQGWSTVQGDSSKIVTNDSTVTIKGDHKLHAIWTEREYTVTFNINKGSGSTTPKCKTTSIKVRYNSDYGSLPIATRKGYTLNGWYTAEIGGSKVSSTTKVKQTMNHTLFAQWVPVEYQVKFDTNQGSGGTIPNCNVDSKFVRFDSAYGELPIPTRVNYTFNGWYTEPDGGTVITDTTIVNKIEGHTLYAQWTAK